MRIKHLFAAFCLGLAFLWAPLAHSFTYGTPVENAAWSGTTATITVTSVPSGATVVVFFTWNPGGGSITLSGVSDGSSYSQAGSTVVSGSSVDGALFYLTSASSGSHAIVATFAGGSTGGYIVAYYITGTGAFDGATGADSSFAGTGANAVKGGSVTTTASGDSVSGFFFVVSGGGALTAGTTPATFTSNSCVTTGSLCEYLTQSASGAIQASATSSVNSDVIAYTLAFKASGGAAVPQRLGLFGVGN
jgi:hypothetical protein